jgi:hypothetical protein
MNGTAYRGIVAVRQLVEAQRMLDLHVMSLPDGACRTCRSTGSCAARERAMATFARARRLPRRRPGASHPELIGARRVTFATVPGVANVLASSMIERTEAT